MRLFLVLFHCLFLISVFSQTKKKDLNTSFSKAYKLLSENDNNSAIHIIDSTLNVIKGKKDKDSKRIEAKMLNLKGYLHTSLSDFKTAESFYLKSMHIFDSINDVYWYNWTYITLIQNYVYFGCRFPFAESCRINCYRCDEFDSLGGKNPRN